MHLSQAKAANAMPPGVILVVITDSRGKRVGEVSRGVRGGYLARSYTATGALAYLDETTWRRAVSHVTAGHN